MDTKLNLDEIKSLKKFIILYFGTTFILLSIIFIISYRLEIDTQKDLTLAKMKNFSFKISSNIILSQMNGKRLDYHQFQSSRYRFALFDKEGKKVYGDDIEDKNLILYDKTPLGHLGIWSIKVADTNFNAIKHKILFQNIIEFLISYLIISIVGYFLIQLFIKPIKETRKKLDDFIKNTTHELNTPITALLMCVNEEGIKNPKNIERIQISVKRISEIYKDLVYLFLDKRDNSFEELNLKELIIEQLKYFEIIAKKKQIFIKKDINDFYFVMDREDFIRLFSNLLSNSIKYNRIKGSIEIILKDNSLIISDNGIGIEEEKQNLIFNRYFRATTNNGGFGIGLSIVEQISKKYNIKIKLISTEDRGTQFILKFPS